MNEAQINNLTLEETLHCLDTSTPMLAHLVELLETEMCTLEEVEEEVEEAVEAARKEVILEIHEAHDLLNPGDWLPSEDL